MIVAEGGRGFQSKECVSHTHSSFSTKSGMFFALQIFKTPSFFAHYCHNRELLLEIRFRFCLGCMNHCSILLFLAVSSAVQIPILAWGQGIDLPVYVEREMMDLRICMLDRLYQDSIVVHNR